jgi:hypothetical protein
MSGYTDDTLIREGIEVWDTPFLQKPFTLTELAHMVREVLDRKDVQVTTPAVKRSLGSSG